MSIWRNYYMAKKSAAKKKKSRLKLMNLKVTDKDRALIMARARRFQKGQPLNLSAWLREAGLKYKPV